MATSKKKESTAKDINDTAGLDAYMDALVHPLKEEIAAVRDIIKSNKKINERVKWSAPSFFYKHDMVTFNHRQEKFVQLVFHYAPVVTIDSPLLTGDYKDRRLAAFKDMKEVKANKKELQRIIAALVDIADAE